VRREAQRIPPPRIDFVEVDAGAERYGPPAERLFGELLGKPLDPDAVARRVTALYGRGGLDTPHYHLSGDASRYGLAIDAHRSSLGTISLRFGLSLQDDFQGNANSSAAMRFVMADIPRNAGEWVTALQIGSPSAIASELFLPLASFSGWF